MEPLMNIGADASSQLGTQLSTQLVAHVAAHITLLGIGATAFIDVWALARKRIFDIAPPNYALVGRWLAYMARGQFRHEAIAASPPMAGEGAIGWIVHYAIGIAYAAALVGIYGVRWIVEPTIGPALIVGAITVLAPYLIMQPAMGAGIASSKTPRPASPRLHTLVTHVFFGLGLYASGCVIHWLWAL